MLGFYMRLDLCFERIPDSSPKDYTSPYSNMKSYHIYQHIRYVTHREMGNFLRIIFWKKIVFTHSLEVSLKVVLYTENHVVHIKTIYGH